MNYSMLVESIVALHHESIGRAAAAVNHWLTLRNWLVGAYLVNFEQDGANRARYGEELLANVSKELGKRKLRGLGVSMLKNCRQFYRLYPQIRQSVSGDFEASLSLPLIRQSPIGEFDAQDSETITQTSHARPVPLSTEQLLRLSWTHFIELIRLADPWKRAFYENECLKDSWSVRQLQRQIGSLLYERTGLSTDKQAVIEAARQNVGDRPQDISELIRDPYVLEFTGLGEKPRYRELDLESALLDHLQNFLLELGTGFASRLDRNGLRLAMSTTISILFSTIVVCVAMCFSI